MTDAPERIWIDTIRRNGPWRMVAGADCPRLDGDINAAYIRADLSDAKDARIAELEEAVARCETVFLRYAEIHDAKRTDDGRAKAGANLVEAYRCRTALEGKPA